MNLKTAFSLLSPILLLTLIAGCERNETAVKSAFDIPPSLIDRMRTSYNNVRNKTLGVSASFDGEEMVALLKLGYENATEIAEKPRGEMSFADDGRSEEERRKLWPFDVEAFEAKLEASLVQDKEGLYLLKDEDGELTPFNPTMRWVNAEMEKWAVQQLDAHFTRVKPDVHAKITGKPVNADEEIMMWTLAPDGDEYFSIEESDGAWTPRSYQYIIWNGKDTPMICAEFNSFPSQKEAVTMRTGLQDSRSLNNLAVLYWRHRVFPLQFDPGEIKWLLEVAQSKGVACATENMNVLHAHIPEVKESNGNEE